MALPRELGAKQPESLVAGVAICALAAYLYSLSRFLAARTAEMIIDSIYRMATSPVEVCLLALLALWLASWSLDRHTKAAQLFSSIQLKLLSSLLVQSTAQRQQQQRQPATAPPAVAGSQSAHSSSSSRGGKVAPASPAAASSPASTPSISSPGKELTSHRLPEHSLTSGSGSKKVARKASKRQHARQEQHPASPMQQPEQLQHVQQPQLQQPMPEPQQQQRWSLDGGSQPARRQFVAVRPKPRSSLDFEAAPFRRSRPQSTAAAAAAAAHRRRARRHLSMADHLTAPRLDGGGAASGSATASGTASHTSAAVPSSANVDQRWQPRRSMQLIASGQQLAELAAADLAGSSQRSSSDSQRSVDSSPASSPAFADGTNVASQVASPQSQQQQPQQQQQEAVPSQPCSIAAAVSASAAAAAPAAALSSWLPSLPSSSSLLGWSPFSAPGSSTEAGNSGSSSSHSDSRRDDADAAGAATSSSSSSSSSSSAAAAAAAPAWSAAESAEAAPTSPVSQLVASAGSKLYRSGATWATSTTTACAAWASSTVESLALPSLNLWRFPSSPPAATSERQASGEGSCAAASSSAGGGSTTVVDEVAPAAAGVVSPSPAASARVAPRHRRSSSSGWEARRLQSVDGASARHYSHGGICTADPARKQALQQLAFAARLQLPASTPAAAQLPLASRHLPAVPAASDAPTEGLSNGSAAGGQLPSGMAALLGADAGCSVLASIGLDGDCPEDIRAHVTDDHLLQFAALVGEEAAAAAAAQLGVPAGWAGDGCLLGAADGPEGCSEAAWEQVIDHQEGGLAYEVWRQPLRKGLYMYRSRALFADVAPRDLRPFHLDDHARYLWDENVLDIRRVRPPSQPGSRVHKHSEWCLHAYRSRFPRPMAAREYQYARRVWHRPSDGGCYVVCRGLPLPDAEDGYRAVKVTDFASASVIRAAADGAGTEVVSLYFEDSLVRPGLAKMAVKGMWGYMKHYEAALRVFAEARQAAVAQHAIAAATSPTSGAGARRRRPGQAQQQQQGRSVAARLVAAAGEESDAGCSSGEDATTRSAYTAMARRLGRLGRGAASRLGTSRGGDASGRLNHSRLAGRLIVLAGIKMVHAMLAARR